MFECEKLQYTALPQESGYGWETLTPNANPLSKICLKNLYFPYFSPCAKLEGNYYSLLIKFVFLGIIRFFFIFWDKNCGRMMIYVSYFG